MKCAMFNAATMRVLAEVDPTVGHLMSRQLRYGDPDPKGRLLAVFLLHVRQDGELTRKYNALELFRRKAK